MDLTERVLLAVVAAAVQYSGYGVTADEARTYTVEPVNAGDTQDVLKFLRRTFYVDEPLNKAVHLITSANDTCPELDEYCSSSLPGMSYKAVDPQNNMVGVMISGIAPLREANDGNDLLSQAKRCRNPKFQKILYILAQRETAAKLWEKYPNDQKLVEVKVAATDPGWRRMGIMNKLLNQTIELAIQRNIRLIRIDTSSAYSAMSAERNGFTPIYRARYTDIKKDGQPLIVPEAPHVHDTLTPSHETFTVTPVAEPDVESIIKLLRKTFYLYEPMNEAVGLVSSENDPCPELDDICRSSLLEGLSFKAAAESTGEVVGVTVTGITPLDCKGFLAKADEIENPKLRKIMHVIGHQSMAAKLWEKYPQDQHLMEVKITSTHPEWQRRGILHALVTRSLHSAEQRKIRLIRIDATSAYTAMCAKKLGFKCVLDTLYTDIKKNGEPVIVPKAPHLKYGVYIKELYE